MIFINLFIVEHCQCSTAVAIIQIIFFINEWFSHLYAIDYFLNCFDIVYKVCTHGWKVSGLIRQFTARFLINASQRFRFCIFSDFTHWSTRCTLPCLEVMSFHCSGFLDAFACPSWYPLLGCNVSQYNENFLRVWNIHLSWQLSEV